MSLPTAVNGSVIETLRANRERLKQDQTKTMQIPGWDSLYVRYKRLPWEQVRNLSSMDENGDATQQVGEAIDVLIAACDGFLFVDDEGNSHELGYRYEQDLAKLTGDNESTMPAEVVMSVLSDELTLMSHVGDYMVWAARQESTVAGELGKDSNQMNVST